DTNLCAGERETRHRLERPARVGVQRSTAEQLPRGSEIAVGEQRLPMRGAVQRRELAGLARDRDHLTGGDMVIDEEDLDPLADGVMRGLAEPGRQILEEVVEERGQHVAPVAS